MVVKLPLSSPEESLSFGGILLTNASFLANRAKFLCLIEIIYTEGASPVSCRIFVVDGDREM